MIPVVLLQGRSYTIGRSLDTTDNIAYWRTHIFRRC